MWASEEFQGKRAGGDNQPATFSGFRPNKRFSCYKWKFNVLSLTKLRNDAERPVLTARGIFK